MISQKYFRYEIGWDDLGLMVTVIHEMTGYRRTEYVSAGENTTQIQSRMVYEFIHNLIDINRDLRFTTTPIGGHGPLVSMYGGSYWTAEHISSGHLVRMAFEKTVSDAKEQITDRLLETLWRKGILAVPDDDKV